MASPIIFSLFMHFALRAASRAAWIAGSSKPIRIPTMAMATSNSMSVKPRFATFAFIEHLQGLRVSSDNQLPFYIFAGR